MILPSPALLLLLPLVRQASSAQDVPSRPVAFLSSCRGGLSCRGLQCRALRGGGGELSLERIQDVECGSDGDCLREETGLQCVKGGCRCPAFQALNVSTCGCEAAARCEAGGCVGQHQGRRCEDSYCSCYSSPDFSTLLVDPTSLFCVLPAGDPLLTYGTDGLVVLCVLGGLAVLVLLTVLGLVLHSNCVCEKGAYECEDVPDAPELPHVAAWDHPSLDYIPKSGEEDIVFTLALAKDTVRMSNASTIHVVDEEITDYNLNNDNRGYVDDVDDPRHD